MTNFINHMTQSELLLLVVSQDVVESTNAGSCEGSVRHDHTRGCLKLFPRRLIYIALSSLFGLYTYGSQEVSEPALSVVNILC